jgi:hypothetical protein
VPAFFANLGDFSGSGTAERHEPSAAGAIASRVIQAFDRDPANARRF